MASYIYDTIKLGDETYDATEATCDNGGKVDTESITVEPKITTQTITPSTGKLIDKVNVNAVTSDIDSNIQSDNIKKDVEILGVTGTLEMPDLSDATAAADDILVGKTAYTGEGKVTGTYKDMLQERVDQTNSCASLFAEYKGTDLSFINKLDTSKVTDISGMFQNLWEVTSLDLSWMDTSNAIKAGNIFYNCHKLTNLILPNNFINNNTEKIISIFSYCSALIALDLSSWDTSNISTLSMAFQYDSKLISLNVNGWNTSNVKDMYALFDGCRSLTLLDLSSWDTSNNKRFVNIFNNCEKLENIIGVIDTISCTDTNMNFLIYRCLQLKNITLKNVKLSLTIGSANTYGQFITNASLLNTAQELWDNTDQALGGTRTLTMSTPSKKAIQSIYVKLITPTAEQEAADPYINNKKPCVECESTEEGAMTLEEYIILKGWAIA